MSDDVEVCRNGHPQTPEVAAPRLDRPGKTVCRICRSAYMKKYNAAHWAAVKADPAAHAKQLRYQREQRAAQKGGPPMRSRLIDSPDLEEDEEMRAADLARWSDGWGA